MVASVSVEFFFLNYYGTHAPFIHSLQEKKLNKNIYIYVSVLFRSFFSIFFCPVSFLQKWTSIVLNGTLF